MSKFNDKTMEIIRLSYGLNMDVFSIECFSCLLLAYICVILFARRKTSQYIAKENDIAALSKEAK